MFVLPINWEEAESKTEPAAEEPKASGDSEQVEEEAESKTEPVAEEPKASGDSEQVEEEVETEAVEPKVIDDDKPTKLKTNEG